MNPIKTSWLIALLVVSSTLIGCSNEVVSHSNLAKTDQSLIVEEKPGQSNFYYVESGNKPLAQVEEAIRNSMSIEDVSEYYYNFVDLNGDRNHEVLIYLKNANQTSGNLLIMSSDFKKSLGTVESQMPVIVLNSAIQEHLWADLAIYSGNGQYLKYVFIDNAYQLSENSKENVIDFYEINGVGYLSDLNDKNGFKIQ